MTAFLFVTDLDNTLVGDDTALAELNQQLSQHRQDYGTKIVYATGRSLFLYRKLTTEKSLLQPDALITSVGTELYFNPTEDTFDPEWAQIVSQGWDREQVIATASHFADLILQEDSEQRPFKVSYHLTEQAAVEVLPQLKSALQERQLNVKLVYSTGFDLDILPLKADKGLAVQFLRQKWGIEVKQTVVCGDSGNDIALFSVGEERGIIVGNASSELWQWYQANQTDYRYLAEAHCAGGILEGLHHFGFLSD
ncbi:MAG TPA: sucrose-phosphate phosphatase [Cyanobacteria bacterium UBA11162]|nr:sucrose-phosphate phosphatase [Cyanobacteria bacterium UBA12227]HAX88874.1 sucrose-phosphate phosphatase [Cyanobacteria bacterium UBA11370]HBL14457.1 sucrose-phosphate phosphatase [Cyanobacteria bacterium UBA11162]HBY80701.1 sucrose-phosphate phosphatase [Cyanobacteria bacterium UBA11148]